MQELHTETNDIEVLGQEPEVVEPQEVESVEEVSGTGQTGSDLATEEGREDQDGVNQDAVQRAINKQHAKYREEERKRKALEKELEEMRAKLPKEPEAPEIPPIPDPYDENYEELVRARDEALLNKVKYDVAQEASLAQQQKLEDEKQAKRQEEIQALVTNYDNKAKSFGLDVQEVHKAGKAIVDYGINDQLAEFLLADDDGPLLTQYLASNPRELDELRSMPITQASIYVHTKIREDAKGLKPKQTQAPDPAPSLSGNGVGDMLPDVIKGAVFE